jgi:hypothetical protein
MLSAIRYVHPAHEGSNELPFQICEEAEVNEASDVGHDIDQHIRAVSGIRVSSRTQVKRFQGHAN